MKRIIILLSLLGLGSGATLLGGNFIVDTDASEVAVDAKASPPHTFSCVAKHYTCDIDLDPSTLALKSATFEFKFADLDSGNDKRDAKMLRWMDHATFPSARFVLKEVVQEDGQSVGKGTFSMHGATRELAIPFKTTRKGDKIIIDGETQFDYVDWDLEVVRLLFFTVKPSLQARFHLEGTLKGGN